MHAYAEAINIGCLPALHGYSPGQNPGSYLPVREAINNLKEMRSASPMPLAHRQQEAIQRAIRHKEEDLVRAYRILPTAYPQPHGLYCTGRSLNTAHAQG